MSSATLTNKDLDASPDPPARAPNRIRSTLEQNLRTATRSKNAPPVVDAATAAPQTSKGKEMAPSEEEPKNKDKSYKVLFNFRRGGRESVTPSPIPPSRPKETKKEKARPTANTSFVAPSLRQGSVSFPALHTAYSDALPSQKYQLASLDSRSPSSRNESSPSLSLVRPRPMFPDQHSYSHDQYFSASMTSLSSPVSNTGHRELIRTATSMLCKVVVKPHVHMNLTETEIRDWEEVEMRMRALARLERSWGKSGEMAAGSSSNLSTAEGVGMSSSGLSASGEERERKLFCEALRDGFVLCELMNKLRSSSIVCPDTPVDEFVHVRNVKRFLVACSSYGLSSEDLFQRDDLLKATSDSLARVARTIIALIKFVDAQRSSDNSNPYIVSPPPSSPLRAHSRRGKNEENDHNIDSDNNNARGLFARAMSHVVPSRIIPRQHNTKLDDLSQIGLPDSPTGVAGTHKIDEIVSGQPPKLRYSNSSLDTPEDDFSPREHSFVKTTFSKPLVCRVCLLNVKKSSVLCASCSLIAHSKCVVNAPPTCDLRAQLLQYAQYADKGNPSSSYSNPLHGTHDVHPLSPISDVAYVHHSSHTSTKPGSNVPRSSVEDPRGSDAGSLVPFPSGEHGSLSPRFSVSKDRPRLYDESRLPRARVDSDAEGTSAKRRTRLSLYDELGVQPRTRLGSRGKLGVASENASAYDLLTQRDSLDGSVVHKPLIIREEGKPVTYFQLGNCIGRGQFGSVYRALNLNTGQMVAVKRIRLEGRKEDEVTTLMREVDLVKNLSHPSIVKYESMARDDDTLSIVLEYAENGSLKQTLKSFGKLNEHLVATYVLKILEGLHYLHHECDIVHCNLKAANILTTKNGNVKLSDFGMSLNLRVVEHERKVVAGTPNWMAPEVIELKGASTKSDIWSLACTVIELLTGNPPYAEIAINMSVMSRIVEDEMPPIPEGCTPLLKDFLTQCFDKDPTKRPSADLLCEHQWLKKNWGAHKELRPQDSIPFLRRVAILQKSEAAVRDLSQIDMPDSPILTDDGSWEREVFDFKSIRGYDVDSLDEDADSESLAIKESPMLKPFEALPDKEHLDSDADSESSLIKEGPILEQFHGDLIVVHAFPGRGKEEEEYFSAAILPICSQEILVEQSRSIFSTVLTSVTLYGALKDATEESDYSAVFEKLKIEWTYVGGLLLGLAALEASVFAVDPGSSFKVDDFAQHAIASGSIATGLGIVCDSWFLLRYYRLDLPVFVLRAKDIYGSYLFFSLSARLPVLSAVISLTSLLFFLGRVAYNSFPGVVVALSLIFALIMGLQFVVWGVSFLVCWTGSLLTAIVELAKHLVPDGPVIAKLGRIITGLKAAASAFREVFRNSETTPTRSPSQG